MAENNLTAPQAKHFPSIRSPMFAPGTFKGKTAFITGGGKLSKLVYYNFQTSILM